MKVIEELSPIRMTMLSAFVLVVVFAGILPNLFSGGTALGVIVGVGIGALAIYGAYKYTVPAVKSLIDERLK